jgi:4-hydroxy-3-methylbut-2-enyl diphosphate reductase IspH
LFQQAKKAKSPMYKSKMMEQYIHNNYIMERLADFNHANKKESVPDDDLYIDYGFGMPKAGNNA